MTAGVQRRVWAVVPAAGSGTRFASSAAAGPKQYAPLAGATVLEWALRALRAEARVVGVVLVLAPDDTRFAGIAAALADPKIFTTVGGSSRQASVLNGLAALQSRAAPEDWVLVHDAARPCLTSVDLGALIDAVAAPADGPLHGAILAAPVHDTVKRERSGIAAETVDRDGLWRALTPQLFGFELLQTALRRALAQGVEVTDEAQAMERLGMPGRLVRGSPFNIKVTTHADLAMAETLLRGLDPGLARAERRATEACALRIGQGFDVHAYGDGDHVVLGGVRIDHSRGVIAHSDGDVVIHALCDAVLGALGEGDIGQHFPDTEPRFRGADSRVFLREVAARMRAAGLALVNADVTVLAEAPRIARHRHAMAENLAADLEVPTSAINIKATTTERLGFVGRGEGLAASAAVLLAARPAR